MELVRVPCPACARVLINPSTGADGQIRCTNCGQRFTPVGEVPKPAAVVPAAPGTLEADVPAPATASSAPMVSAPTPEAAEMSGVPAGAVPSGRPPQPASYGSAMLLGYLLFFGLTFAALLQLVFVVPQYFRHGGVNGEEFFAFLAFLGVIAAEPLVGLMVVRAARALARMDAAALELAWRLHALPRPPPAPEGSELPYILPCMAGGGVTVMFGIIAVEQLGGGFGGLLLTMIWGLLLILAGLVFADIRRFCWRTTWLANTLAQTMRNRWAVPPTHGAIVGLTIAAACIAALASLILLGSTHSGDLPLVLVGLLVGIGTMVTVCLVINRMMGAAGAWCVTGRLLAGQRPLFAPLSAPAAPLNALPLAGGIWGLLIVIVVFVETGSYTRGEEWAGVLFCLASALMAVSLGLILNRLHFAFRLAEHLGPSAGRLASRCRNRSFMSTLNWGAFAVITGCWLCGMALVAGEYRFFRAWVILSGFYYHALCLVLLLALVRGLADRFEVGARTASHG